MKQNKSCNELIFITNNNTNHEPKVIPVVPDLNKSLPNFTERSDNNIDNNALDWLDIEIQLIILYL